MLRLFFTSCSAPPLPAAIANFFVAHRHTWIGYALSQRQCTCNRVLRERDISPVDFVKIYAAEHGRNDTQASTDQKEYFGRTDARVAKVKVQPGRERPRIHG